MTPAIELHNISKTFTERNWRTFLLRRPRRTKALDRVSLTVNRGTVMGLLGPNGAGKTTLIKILATLVSPDSGQGRIEGLRLQGQDSAIRSTLGLVSSNERSFYWRLSGRENLDFFATLYDLHGKAKKKRILEVLALVDMEGRADLRFMSYSAGQKQRLSIARAMLSNPEILLLDEATSSLDPIATRKLLHFTRKTLADQEGKTIVWCTHNLHEADEICDNLTILHRGQVLHSGTNAAIKGLLTARPRFSLTVDRLHSALHKQDDFKVLPQGISGNATCQFTCNQEEIPPLIQTLCHAGILIFECRQLTQDLEAAFTQLIATKGAGSQNGR